MREHTESCGNPENHTAEYCRAYDVLQKHAERMGLEEGRAQYRAHILAGRKAATFGTGRRYPFRPSETLMAACKLLGDPTLTLEKALGFIHDPTSHAWDAAQRMRNTH